MTDIELAEDYASIATSDRGYYYEGLKEGFLAGLRQTNWHKVADGDLPKRDERFTTNISVPVMTQDHDFVCYCFDDKKWYSHGVVISNVIAWCDIPVYEE